MPSATKATVAQFDWDGLDQYKAEQRFVDGVYTVTGSTNWSISGESEQDNHLTLNRNAVIASELRAVLDLNHDWMLKQMAESRAKEAGAPKG